MNYQWFKDGSPIRGATRAELAFNAIQFSDSGTYHLEAASPFATGSSARVRLEVFGPPSFTRHPASRTAGAGEDVRFAVEVSGSAPLSYQWLKDGAPVAGALGPELVLKSVQSRDAGAYSVQVSNAYGNAVSARADLAVLTTAAPAITVQPQSRFAAQGATSVGCDRRGTAVELPMVQG